MAATDAHQKTSAAGSDGMAVACAACTHPWAEHDQIAARFCAATIAGHHERGCVCTAQPSNEKAGQKTG